MEKLFKRFNELEEADPSELDSLSELKEFHENITVFAEELSADTETSFDELETKLTELNDSSGFREKALGGWFGGNKEAATDLKETKEDLENVSNLTASISVTSQDITDNVFEQATAIIASGDEEFAALVAHRNLMGEAVEFTDNVLQEVNEAIEALNEAEDAEEWDQWTDSGFADMNSDFANQDAADEVDDVTRILRDYRTFLHSMGENDAAYLEGADFDFDWGDMLTDDFFGDFWGSEMMLNKINRAQGDMVDLHGKIAQLYNSFAADYDKASDVVNERIDEEWENA